MRVYLVLMQGPEWNEVVRVFADQTPPPRGTAAAGIRAGWLQQRLEAHDPQALAMLPQTYRSGSLQLQSRFVVDTMEAQ